MKKIITLVCLFSFAATLNASELWDKVKSSTEKAVEKSADVVAASRQKLKAEKTSAQIRSDSHVALNLNFSPINVPFPMAWGANAYFIASKNWMLGVDYLQSKKSIKFFSFEVGEVKEKNYTFQARRFFGNSFNTIMGVGHRNTETRLAKNLFDLVLHSYSETVSEFETQYIRLGLGNQWQFKKKYTFAIDWITINIPFKGKILTSASEYAKSDEDKEDIRDAEEILKYYPSGAVIQMNLGMVF